VEVRASAPAPDPYLAGIALLYQQALAVALARRQPGQAIVAMGHCHMVDGEMSNDSERRIVIGGTEMLPAGIFDPAIAYAALGHLHLAQAVGKQERIRYCGSPIPLSFAEVGYQHQVLRIDIADGAAREVSAIPVPRAVDLLRIPAKPAPLEQVLDELAALSPPELPPDAQPFLEVRVLLDAPQPGMRARVEAALEGKPVRLAKIETSMPARLPSLDDATLTLDQLGKLQPDDIFRRLYQQRFGAEAPTDQLSAFAELMLPGA
jgi:exonuclease SbcD